MKRDLEERTLKFGQQVITCMQELPKNDYLELLIRQLIRSSTSIGANYCEADNAESKKDFIHKIAICRKETKETKYWLGMLLAVLSNNTKINSLLREATELNLIFNKIYYSARRKLDH